MAARRGRDSKISQVQGKVELGRLGEESRGRLTGGPGNGRECVKEKIPDFFCCLESSSIRGDCSRSFLLVSTSVSQIPRCACFCGCHDTAGWLRRWRVRPG